VAILAAAGAVGPALSFVRAGEEAQPPGEPASRSTYVHRIPLRDSENGVIKPASDPTLPFSTRATCGDCHEYDTIRGGWHFSATDPAAESGRPAQPWILVHRATATQLPLSYRGWPGTWRPEAVGLGPWEFVLTFGRHLPGGGPGEPDPKEIGAEPRWLVSGPLEINCLACHSADPAHDQVQSLLQVAEQNFMWAPLATSGLGEVHGSARRMPDTYDPFMEPNAQALQKGAPIVAYDAGRFDAEGRAFFSLVHKPLAERCYFCHTNHRVGPEAPEKWETDQDVHLAAGLVCADCHRNGLDHRIVRGYEGETVSREHPELADFTCRGCHMPKDDGSPPAAHFGAPVPEHVGLPTVHFERLSCTACHSGPKPRMQAGRVQTSRAHALEFHGEHRGDDAPPFIAEPVFIQEASRLDGHEEIVPHRMVWPAFWGRLKDDAVKPISPERVAEDAKTALETRGAGESGGRLSRDQVVEVLKVLASGGEGEPVYVGGGKLHRLGPNGALEAEDHPAARPYAWPLAHDVRPATQALGYGGACDDCHALDSPFFFGTVKAEGPADLGEPRAVPMYELERLSPLALRVWAVMFIFRPYFKAMLFVLAAVMAAVVILYGMRGLRAILQWASARSAGT